jgi:hypothetical protein
VNVLGTLDIVVIAPWIGAGLDRSEAVAAVRISDTTSAAEEVRVERRVVLIGLVDVAPASVGLPDLDQGPGDRLAIVTKHSAADHNALA